LRSQLLEIYDSVSHKISVRKRAMRKVVWDMDPGIDDALALLLALKSPEVQVLGISTVAGNASVEMTSANARRVLEYLNVDNVPVAKGAANPLSHSLVYALKHHGPDGLAQCSLPSPRLPLHPAKAWDFLAKIVLDAPGEVTLVATGPLTNVAYAFQHYPELPEFLAKLVLMGGAYGFNSPRRVQHLAGPGSSSHSIQLWSRHLRCRAGYLYGSCNLPEQSTFGTT